MAKDKEKMLHQLFGAPAHNVQLTPFEVQHLVRELTTPNMEEIGSPAWYAHHEVLQRLNFFAHEQAVSDTDELVMDTFVTADKVTNVIEDLITIEAWKENVYPLLQEELAALPSIKSYLLIYHEALLVNLLEVLLFHKTAAQAGEDHLVDLVDYINRKIVYMLSRQVQCLTRDAAQLHNTPPTAEELGKLLKPLEDLTRQKGDCEFRICMSCLSLLRFLTDHRAALPVTVTSRLLDQHDILLSLVSLMDRKPWYRHRSNGDTEFFEDQQWIVQRNDEASMPKIQAQVWLAIYNLVMDQECRNRYELTSYRKNNLLRLRRHLNEVVYDQIPPLMGLHRTLEELSIMGHHPNQNTSVAPILVELSAEIRERIFARFADKWEDIARKQKSFLHQGSREELQRLANLVLSVPFDKFTTTKRCRTCGRHAEQRCSKCKAEWYCSRDCQVSDWRNHKAVCMASEGSNTKAKEEEDSPTKLCKPECKWERRTMERRTSKSR